MMPRNDYNKKVLKARSEKKRSETQSKPEGAGACSLGEKKN